MGEGQGPIIFLREGHIICTYEATATQQEMSSLNFVVNVILVFVIVGVDVVFIVFV